MADKWLPVALDGSLFMQVDEAVQTQGLATIENAYVTDTKGQSRFWGLKLFCDLGGKARVRGLFRWDSIGNGDLVAVPDDGRVLIISRDGVATDMTAVQVGGGFRPVMTATDHELVIAAGGAPVRLGGEKTELLSDDAPYSTHCAFIDNYLLLVERDSGRFIHSPAGDYRTFDGLDTFAASGKPDNINALLISPYREILLTGVDSIEQFERLANGDVPFYRRWAIGEGVSSPYAILFADNAVFIINRQREVIRFSGQTSTPVSTDIQAYLDNLARLDPHAWDDAWMGGYPDEPLSIMGQRLLTLQLPNAPTPYGTKGMTFNFDFRQKKWSLIYGVDPVSGLPTRWPGWSIFRAWDRWFVGGEGKVYEFTPDTYWHDGQPAIMRGRTGYLCETSDMDIRDVRMRVKRGVGSDTVNPKIYLRVRRDNGPWSRWMEGELGLRGAQMQHVHFGDLGTCSAIQFEWEVRADVQVEIAKLELLVDASNR